MTALRKQHGVSQSAVAEELGLSQSDVSKIEKFERRVDVVEFLDFVNAVSPKDAKKIVAEIVRETLG